MTSARVVDRDRGAARLLDRAAALDGAGVTVGIHADTGAGAHPSGASIVEVAGFVEFGTSEQAPRPFVRAAVDGELGRIEASLARAAERSARGGSVERELAQIGEELAASMRRRLPHETGTTASSVEARVELRSDEQ